MSPRFSWWHRLSNRRNPIRKSTYRLQLDELEKRELLAIAIGVMPSDQNAAEPSDQGRFNFTRTEGGPAVSVNYSVSGSATNGTDYQSISGSISVVAGGTNPLDIIPINDLLIEGTETVTVTIEPGDGYTIGNPSSATVFLADNDGSQSSTPPALVPYCPPCEIVNIVGVAPGAEVNPVRSDSEGPIRYFDGTIQYSSVDLESNGFGTSWGITRSWSNHAAYSTNSLGSNGTVIAQLPYLQQSGTTILAVSGGTTARYFDYNMIPAATRPATSCSKS